VVIPKDGAEGVIATQGGRFNGWALYLLEGKPAFHYNLAGVQRFTIASDKKLPLGEHVIVVDFKYDGGGLGKGAAVTITVDEKTVAQGRVGRTVPFRMSIDETLDIGEDTGTPVSEDYRVPFKFTGNLKRVLIGLSDHKLTAEDEEEIRRARAAIGVAQ
jgi:arylsulfatase